MPTLILRACSSWTLFSASPRFFVINALSLHWHMINLNDHDPAAIALLDHFVEFAMFQACAAAPLKSMSGSPGENLIPLQPPPNISMFQLDPNTSGQGKCRFHIPNQSRYPHHGCGQFACEWRLATAASICSLNLYRPLNLTPLVSFAAGQSASAATKGDWGKALEQSACKQTCDT